MEKGLASPSAGGLAYITTISSYHHVRERLGDREQRPLIEIAGQQVKRLSSAFHCGDQRVNSDLLRSGLKSCARIELLQCQPRVWLNKTAFDPCSLGKHAIE